MFGGWNLEAPQCEARRTLSWDRCQLEVELSSIVSTTLPRLDERGDMTSCLALSTADATLCVHPEPDVTVILHEGMRISRHIIRDLTQFGTMYTMYVLSDLQSFAATDFYKTWSLSGGICVFV